MTNSHVHFFNYHTGRPRFHFDAASDAAAAAAAAAAGAGGGGGTTVWHEGKIDAETLGFWQNKGYDVTDPVKVASELTKQYRAAEKFIGAPPEQIVRMPKADAKPEEFVAFYQRLGVPADAKDYDLSGVKFAGNDLEPAFADAMRAGLLAGGVTKDKAAAIVGSVVKYLESADTSESTVNAQKLADEKANLAKNWGPKYDFNHLQAMEGARRAGIAPEAVKALESQIGYAAVMEHFRKLGANTSEDTFVERGPGGQGDVVTREGAMSRKSELMGDSAWVKRFLEGGQNESREMTRLNTMIDG